MERDLFPDRGWGSDRTAWDCAYLPGLHVPSVTPFVREYVDRSARARESLRWQEFRYGPDPAERLHFFAAEQPAAGLLVFVHGGYWQELTEVESSFAAPDAVDQGMAFAALGYGLAPRHGLEEIEAMVRRAVQWLHEHAGELGVDPDRIVLVGHSAGAHLVAMSLPVEWRPAAMILLSGLCELEPLTHTSVGEAMRLSIEEAVHNSPAHRFGSGVPPTLLARGADEPVGFADQYDCLLFSLCRAGIDVEALVVPDRNHFDLPLGMCDPADPLGRAVLHRIAPREVPG